MNMKNIKSKLAELARTKENNVEIEIEVANKKEFYKFSEMLDDYGFYDYEIIEQNINPDGTIYYYMILKRRDADFDEYGAEKGYKTENMKYNYSGFDVEDDLQDYIVTVVEDNTDGDAETGITAPNTYEILISAMDKEDAEKQAYEMIGAKDNITDIHIASEEELDAYNEDAEKYFADDDFENAPGWGVETKDETISWNDLTWAEQLVADKVLNDIEHKRLDADEINSYIYTVASDAESDCPKDEKFICNDEKVFEYVIDRYKPFEESLKEGKILDTVNELAKSFINVSREGKMEDPAVNNDYDDYVKNKDEFKKWKNRNNQPWSEKPSDYQPINEKPTSIHDLMKHGNI